MSCNVVGKVCAECPFSRAVKPGALGGSPITKYIAQLYGPFMMPCHLHCDFSNPNWKADTFKTPQCRGVATMRANLGIDYLPEPLAKAPRDTSQVFCDLTEFTAHHLQMKPSEAAAYLAQFNIVDLVAQEVSNPKIYLHPVKEKP